MGSPLNIPELSKNSITSKNVSITFHQILQAAFQNNFAIAAWKNVGKQDIHVVVDTSDNYKNSIYPDLESMDPGFLVSPFLNDSNPLNFLIRADIYFKGKTSKTFYYQNPDTYREASEALKFLDSLSIQSQRTTPLFYTNVLDNSPDAQKEEFIHLVELALDHIRNNIFLKVVPSRRETINLPERFDIVETFVKLTDQYPDSFVSFFSIPGKGTWMGASPEVLVEMNEQGIFRTSAVAGTQPGKKMTDLSSVAWTQKEIEEQALVSRYIINCFKKIRLREFEEYGPKTILAGNLVHLKTDFTVNTYDVNFPQLGSVMLKLLHPTSAVCGMPKETSLEFIKSQEKYNREYYSGYLGPVNIENKTSLYVNLRCAQLMEGKAHFYAGAGITIDSDPEKEWVETVIKNQTIRKIIVGRI